MNKRRPVSQEGSILIVTLLIIASLFFIGTGIIRLAYTESLIAQNQADLVLLQNIAEAGLETGLAAVLSSYHYPHVIYGEIAGLDGRQAYYEVSFDQHPEGRLVSSTGYLDQEYSLTVQVLFKPAELKNDSYLVVRNIAVKRVALRGNLHVNKKLAVEESLSLLEYSGREGAFSYCSRSPFDIDINGYLYVESLDSTFTHSGQLPAAIRSPVPLYMPHIQIDAVERLFTPTIISGSNPRVTSIDDFPGYLGPLPGEDPVDYIDQNVYLFENGLVIDTWHEPLSFSGVIIVRGEGLQLTPSSELEINGIIITEKPLRLHGKINHEDNGNILAILSHGGVVVEKSTFPGDLLDLGGYTFIFSHGPVAIGSSTLFDRLAFKGAVIGREIDMYDTDYYHYVEPFEPIFEYLPGIKVAVVEWLKIDQ